MKKISLCAFLLLSMCVATFANSLAEIRQNKLIRIGVYEAEPPFGKLSDDGSFEGFEVELARVLAERIFGEEGGQIEMIPVTNEVRFPLLKDNKADMIVAAVSVTEDRRPLADFSMPYFSVNLGILTKKSSKISALQEFNEKKLGALKKTTGEAFAMKKGLNMVYCNDSLDCYQKVKTGEIDGYVNNNLFVYAYPILDDTVEVPLGNLGNTVFLAIAVQKGNETLLNFINQELIKLSKEGFFKEAYNNTFEPFYKGTVNKKYFLLDDLYNSFF